MSSMGYVTIEGEEQGRIEGSGQHQENEGLIEMFSFDHEVAIPRTANEALTTGRPVHKEIVMGKMVDPSTPKLYKAMDQHERLKRVEFEWYAYNRNGIRERVFSIELQNARVIGIKPSMPDYFDPASDKYRFLEHVSLAYETIIWSYGHGDIQFETSWQQDET